MIISFKCRETEQIWRGIGSLKFPNNIWERALRKLRQLDAAFTLGDLKNPPANHLEALKGDRKSHMSIRVNQQWRLCFKWQNGEVSEVELVDYH